jgi:hypothetical protein
MKKLKTLLMVSFWGMVTMTYSQINQPIPFSSDTQRVMVDETYLVELIQNAQVKLCKVDSVNDWILAKDMEIFFTDSSRFYSAYIESGFYTTLIASFINPFTAYCEIDDIYGNKMVFDEKEIKKFPILKAALDNKLQTTEITMK